MSLVNLFNRPTAEPNIWSFSNQDQHRAIVESIRDNFGLRINLYPLEPFPIGGGINEWLRAHQTMHNEFTSILGIQGFDLTGLDLEDERIVEAWTWVHASEHRDAARLLGI